MLSEGVLRRCVRVSDLKAYCDGVCVCLTSSNTDAEGLLSRCVHDMSLTSRLTLYVCACV